MRTEQERKGGELPKSPPKMIIIPDSRHFLAKAIKRKFESVLVGSDLLIEADCELVRKTFIIIVFVISVKIIMSLIKIESF